MEHDHRHQIYREGLFTGHTLPNYTKADHHLIIDVANMKFHLDIFSFEDGGYLETKELKQADSTILSEIKINRIDLNVADIEHNRAAGTKARVKSNFRKI